MLRDRILNCRLIKSCQAWVNLLLSVAANRRGEPELHQFRADIGTVRQCDSIRLLAGASPLQLHGPRTDRDRALAKTKGGEGACTMLWLPKGTGGSLHRCTGACLTRR